MGVLESRRRVRVRAVCVLGNASDFCRQERQQALEKKALLDRVLLPAARSRCMLCLSAFLFFSSVFLRGGFPFFRINLICFALVANIGQVKPEKQAKIEHVLLQAIRSGRLSVVCFIVSTLCFCVVLLVLCAKTTLSM